MPTSTPVATGSIATPRAASEPKASSSSALISTVPAMASRRTSVSICARLSTLNSGAPLICSASPPAFSSANPWRTRVMAACCASRSAPGALLIATSSARWPWREDHTPSSLRGALPGISASAMRTVSPVGSRSRIGLMALPAGVPSSDKVSPIASRSPVALKRCASTAGLSW